MAEGWGKALKGDQFHFYSAGTKTHGMNPYAIEVMKEAGVDISGHHSKTLDELDGVPMDYVFTVCSDAHETCPVFPGGKVIHVGFDDPPRLAQGLSDQEAIRAIYRRVRDEIKATVEQIETYLGV